MISEQELIRLLEKRGNDQCSEEELRLIDEYLEAQPAVFPKDEVSEDLISDTWTRINLAIDRDEIRRKRKHAAGISLRIAASIVLAITASLFLYQKKENIYNYIHPVTYTVFNAKAGQNVTVSLPDGSVILLNQNSRLSYSNRFNDTLREVSLNGEAYFQVAKNKAKPFIIHTGRIQTRVLGTSFNLEAYPFTKRIAVELITGKIWLTADNDKKSPVNYVLTPNQAVEYNVINGQAEKKNVHNAANYAAWKDGKIKFSGTPMDEVVKRLNITYRSRIALKDTTLKSQLFYGEFGTGEKVTDVVKTICILIKASYQAKPDGELAIYPGYHNKQSY